MESLFRFLEVQVESDQINFNAAISASEKCQKWQLPTQMCMMQILFLLVLGLLFTFSEM